MAAQPDLSYAFGLEPKRAVEYFESLGYEITWDWRQTADAIRSGAFAVSKSITADILKDLRDGLTDALRKGTTERAFADRLIPILQAKGWWGTRIAVGADGGAQRIELGSPNRLSTIYRTNLQSMLMAGRYRQFIESVDTHPYWMYVAVLDAKTRPSHRALSGRVFRWDDPIWQHIWPPNGYNCRCRVVALTGRQVERMGVEVESGADHLRAIEQDYGFDPRTGEVLTRPGVEWTGTGPDGKPVRFRPDPGFGFNAGANSTQAQVAGLKIFAALGGTLASAALAELVTSAEFKAGYAAWLAEVRAQAHSRGTSTVIGYLGDRELRFLAERQIVADQLGIELRDALLVGRKAERTARMGRALDPVELDDLPQRLLAAEQILWDPQNETLVYVLPSIRAGAQIKLVVEVGRLEKGREPFNSVRSVHRMSADALAGNIRGGVYVELKK